MPHQRPWLGRSKAWCDPQHARVTARIWTLTLCPPPRSQLLETNPGPPPCRLTIGSDRRAADQRAGGQTGEYHGCCYFIHVQFFWRFSATQWMGGKKHISKYLTFGLVFAFFFSFFSINPNAKPAQHSNKSNLLLYSGNLIISSGYFNQTISV